VNSRKSEFANRERCVERFAMSERLAMFGSVLITISPFVGRHLDSEETIAFFVAGLCFLAAATMVYFIGKIGRLSG
jgi:hypothetical protein